MITQLTDRVEILEFLLHDRALHLYAIGDLDDFFFRYTTWNGLKEKSRLRAVILLYTGLSVPTVLALNHQVEPLAELWNAIIDYFPDQFYAHLSEDLISVVGESHTRKSYGRSFKMILADTNPLNSIDIDEVRQLDLDDADILNSFYEISYPGNWFESYMLKTGMYFGLFRNQTIIAAGGVHVYSPAYNVAALGNIAVHPDFRGQGLGKAISAATAISLLKQVDNIGLNVNCDNTAALAVYRSLGFKITARYEECMLYKK